MPELVIYMGIAMIRSFRPVISLDPLNVNGMAYQRVWAGANQFMVQLDGHRTAPVTAERHARPDGKHRSGDRHQQTDPEVDCQIRYEPPIGEPEDDELEWRSWSTLQIEQHLRR